MTEFDALIATLSLTMGVAWASGINLYAAVLVLGIGGATGNIALPESLQVVQDPMVIAAAGIMYAVQFFADKTPGVDTGWDSIHTFIRIPAGAMLAAASVGDVTPALQVTAGLLGGTLSAATHATKAGTRVLINTSPEPFSNWAASISEDIAVLGGLWIALNYPLVFIGLLAIFVLLMIWLLPRLWRAIRTVLHKIGQWLGISRPAVTGQQPTPAVAAELERLKTLLDQGALSATEYQQAKQKVLTQ
ncbi:MAG TPA: DUF4126 family protein [Spongiibacteraceae bacterium]|jgi:hypothetical protein|nr:DUF4126 family protein [Spongiibacteraceae bacterium]HUH36997.1 DUF4126 family protein [Spongiibacteraceae bacterium]